MSCVPLFDKKSTVQAILSPGLWHKQTHTLTLQLIDGIGLWARSVKRSQSLNKEGKLMFPSLRHLAWGLVGRQGR